MQESGTRNTHLVTVYVDEDTKNELVQLAKTNDRSVTAELRIALRRHLRLEKEKVA